MDNPQKRKSDFVLSSKAGPLTTGAKLTESETENHRHESKLEESQSNEILKKIIEKQRMKLINSLINENNNYSNRILSEEIQDSTKVAPKISKKRNRESNESQKNNEVFPSASKENNTKQESLKKKNASLENKNGLRKLISKLNEQQNKNANLTPEEIGEILFDKVVANSGTRTDVKEDNNYSKQPNYFIGNLNNHQMDDLKWLIDLDKNNLNGILSDEMNLGKIMQIIAFICHLIQNKQSGPFLIVVPFSTLPNWLIEFEKYAPELPIVVFHGSPGRRSLTYKKIKKTYQTHYGIIRPITLTTYETLIKEKKALSEENWRQIIIDGGEKLKNTEGQFPKALKILPSLNRLILMDKPLKNNLIEMWSLLNFLSSDLFDKLEVFESLLDAKELEIDNVTEQVRKILNQFVLKRNTQLEMVKMSLKREIFIPALMSEKQGILYNALLSRDIEKITNAEKPFFSNAKPRVKRLCLHKERYKENNQEISKDFEAGSISENYQLVSDGCNHEFSPEFLNEWKEHIKITNDNSEYLMKMKFFNRALTYKQIVNHPYLIHWPLEFTSPRIITLSGKLLLLDKLLKNLKDGGHRVLLFSTMTKFLDIIETYLSLREDYRYFRLDDRMNIKNKVNIIKTFNNDEDIFLFLLTKTAGMAGLNLTGADTIIIFDCDWNSEADIQAMSRCCHRIGQSKPVIVLKMFSKGTIEEQIIKSAVAKQNLEKKDISDDHSLQFLKNKDSLIKLKELLELTYKDIVSDNLIDDEELDKLLDRSDMLSQNC